MPDASPKPRALVALIPVVAGFVPFLALGIGLGAHFGSWGLGLAVAGAATWIDFHLPSGGRR